MCIETKKTKNYLGGGISMFNQTIQNNKQIIKPMANTKSINFAFICVCPIPAQKMYPYIPDIPI